ncbi:DUF308 domain-containing protein [Carnobacterium sp.]|uniref:DUF308 domain-containing protein n=1 Tax=Carnobacterium sp. TaxID=48221 RepID=UPI002FC60ECB
MKKEKVKLLVQGIILLILGVLFMMNPVRQGVLFLLILGSVFAFSGVAIILDGIFITKGVKYKVFRILEGILLGGFGLVFFLRNPESGAVIIIYSLVWLMILMSIFNTIAIFKVKSGIKWLSIALNIIVIWIGVQSLFDPQLALAIFYWTVAFQLIFMGINHITLYFVLPNEEEGIR